MYDPQFMIDLVRARMPFGKYQHWFITDLPVHYLEWFQRKGWPPGKLGQYLSTIFEVKTNGLDHVIDPLKRQYR
ncbi:putative quorum-sensing-regulated virulence factor [Balneola vulgaris]|uniref:putative quorum-sensing-regulated virulence factor n=1 Tax=Balneola vulgaris TaxID=287535 RepID=UPI00035EE304